MLREMLKEKEGEVEKVCQHLDLLHEKIREKTQAEYELGIKKALLDKEL